MAGYFEVRVQDGGMYHRRVKRYGAEFQKRRTVLD